jgi:thiamine biosynthesis protein ThiS
MVCGTRYFQDRRFGMQLSVNRREVQFEATSLTVRQLLDRMRYTFPMIFVRVNGEIVEKDSYTEHVVHDGDEVDVFHLMSGG